MIKFFQSLLIVLLTQILSVYLFAIFGIVFNLNLYNSFNSFFTSYLIQNILIVLIYCVITLLINMYFKNSYRLNYKSRILGFILLITYLIIFYLSNNDVRYFRYFMLVHYPVGLYFRTLPYTMFDLMTRMSIIFSIISAMLGVFVGQKISFYRIKKKKKLSSLSKQ